MKKPLVDLNVSVLFDKTLLSDALNSPITDYEDAVIEVSALRHMVLTVALLVISRILSCRVSPALPQSNFLMARNERVYE
jgi:hypothetical protein